MLIRRPRFPYQRTHRVCIVIFLITGEKSKYMKQAIVITSINGITDAIKGFLEFGDWEVVLVGDKKTPQIETSNYENLSYLSIERQQGLRGNLDKLPYNHYCRKNLGYQFAINQGAEYIADTDDDNLPKKDWGSWISDDAKARFATGSKYINIYQEFTDEFVWPRGLPLDEVKSENTHDIQTASINSNDIAVVQGLADVEPDVDAIFRLVYDREIVFDERNPVILDQGTYSPFNSQNTLWTSEEVFPYLYLPSTVSFRFTDILRSYVAQRGIWEIEEHLAFTSASVVQDRNVHDLMTDFESEVPCYLETKNVVSELERLELEGNPINDIQHIYESLSEIGVVADEELNHLDRWLTAIE